MRKTWKTAEDAAKDISLIYGPCTASDLLKDNEESNIENKTTTNAQTFVDPRTGEEVDISEQCSSTSFDIETKPMGFGRAQMIAEVVEERRVKTLKEQLRMNRPLGLGNKMIESFFKNYEEDEKPSSSWSSWREESLRTRSSRPEASGLSSTQMEEPSATTQECVKKIPSVIGKRKKGAENVLMSSIMKKS